MSNVMIMIVAFLIMTGVALFYVGILQLNMGEGMALSAASIMLFLVVSGYFFETFRYGMWALYLLAGCGLLYLIWQTVRRKKGQPIVKGWQVWLVLAGLFLMWIVIYHNDFIQHIDEFHLWAALVRYMEEKDKLPIGPDFLAGSGQKYLSSSLFIAFFQILGGYNEGNMYVASTLLAFIGFLLPFASCKKGDLKKILFYTALIYVAIYSLYMYTTKALYVDMMLVGWTGGLAGWWMNREKKKRNLILIPVAAIVAHFMKMSSGLLMACYTCLFILLHHVLIEKKCLYKEGNEKKWNILTILLCLAVLAGSAMVIAGISKIHPDTRMTTENGQETEKTVYCIGEKELPESVGNLFAFSSVSMKKVKKTIGPFIEKAMGQAMGSKSNLKLAFVPFMIFLLILLIVYSEINDRKKEIAFYRNYMIFMSLSYSAVLFFSFIFMFAYNLSVTVRGSIRYFTACATFWFVVVMVLFFKEGKTGKVNWQKYILYGLTLIFLYGLNSNFIPNVTALDKEKVTGYDDIMTTKHQAEKVKEVLQENDKVYFIYQIPSGDEPGDADLVTSPVLYYLDMQISNYSSEPWRFYEGGCNISLEDINTLSIQDLPGLLTWGGYTYLWIYRSNNYLRESLPTVLNYDGESVEAGLYQVIYEDGVATGIKYVKELN